MFYMYSQSHVLLELCGKQNCISIFAVVGVPKSLLLKNLIYYSTQANFLATNNL